MGYIRSCAHAYHFSISRERLDAFGEIWRVVLLVMHLYATSYAFYPCYEDGTSASADMHTLFPYLGNRGTRSAKMQFVRPINRVLYIVGIGYPNMHTCNHTPFNYTALFMLIHRPKGVLLVR